MVGSFGVAGVNAVTDRAIGSTSSGTFAVSRFGAKFINADPTLTYTTATVTFDVEHWRHNTQTDDAIPNTFSWAVGSTSLTIDSAGFAEVSALNWNRINPTTTTGALDGNLGINRAQRQFTFSIPWQPGQALVFRWDDQNAANADDILAIDNFNFLAGGARVPSNLAWNTANVTGNWNTTAGNNVWNDGATPVAFQNPDNVTFGDTAANHTITVDAGGVVPVSTTVSNANAAGSYTIAGGSVQGALSKSGAGKLVLVNANAFTSATVTGGTLETRTSAAAGNGTLAIGNATWVVSTAAQTKTGSVNFTGPTTVQADQNLTTLTMGASTAILTKTGAGTWTVPAGFGGINTATALNVSAGVFKLDATNPGDAFGDGQTVALNLGAVVDESLGNGEQFGGLADGPGGGGTWIARATGPAAGNGVTLLGNNDQTFSGRLSAGTNGTGIAGISADPLQRQANLRKEGTGTLTLLGNTSDYQGFTRVNNGVLAFNNINNRGLASALGVGNGTNGADIQIGNAATSAGILRYIGTLAASTDRTVSLLGTGAMLNPIDVATAGTLLTLTGPVSGVGGLTKAGAGTLVLAATDGNTYPTSTTVSAGRLLANNVTSSATGAGPVAVNNNSLLGGTGAIGGNLTMNATSHLQPGSDGPGSLDVGGNLVMLATTALDVEVGGAAPGDGAGFYDQVNVAGTASFNGAALNLSVVGAPGIGAGTDTLYILSRTGGPTTDAFAGLPEGAAVVLGDFAGTITYKANWGGSVGASSPVGGNDVAIVGNAVPEPGALGAIALGAVMGLARRRGRRQG
jgi:autotransporter-associated beta strand protein